MIGAVVTGGIAMGAGLLAAATYYPNATLFGPVIGRGDRRSRNLYLTFDDGPNDGATPRILETLCATGVSATFFMVGAHVRRAPAIARAVAAAGHEIGNHTEHHGKLHFKGPAAIHSELAQAHNTLSEQLDVTPRVFRAPHGFRNPYLNSCIKQFGYSLVGWTFGVWDSDPVDADTIRRRVRRRLKPGAIILLHDGDGYNAGGNRRPTADALPGIIHDAHDAGYRFRPLADLLDAARYHA